MAFAKPTPPKGPRRFWQFAITAIDHFLATPLARSHDSDQAEVDFAVENHDEIAGTSLLEAKRTRQAQDAFNKRRADGRGIPELATSYYSDWYETLNQRQRELLKDAEHRENPSANRSQVTNSIRQKGPEFGRSLELPSLRRNGRF